MHEMSIAQSILDIVREEMQRHGVEKIETVNVAVGKLSAIVPDSLTFCWEILLDGDQLAGLRLNIRVIPLLYRCFECGREFESEEMTFICPHCQADGPMLISGRDMTIESIEVPDNDS